uniref:GB1/RHD3-type G domain-containing protein n=1 Tax=Magallana gigas TaxID=29159 RepID=A0A8W8K0W2_MAGGI
MELLEENLEKIMCHPDVKENPVQIISIAGAFRKGKSFIMGFFLKYLVAQQQDCEWLNENDKIEGFHWRGGSDRVTSGIHIWSKPLVYEKESGKKVAVLLMDTQGIFDNEATFEDCTCIFALSNLISSVQV